jgi:CheY-specific phosphatase CheX
MYKSYDVAIWVMNLQDDGIGHNKNNNSRTKAIAAIPMAGIVVTAALLSGLSLISSYYQQPAIAQQQNMTGGAAGNATNMTAAAGNATNMTAAGNATNMTAAGNATNATTTTAVGGGQVSEEEGGRIGLEEERAEGENESPGQSLEEEEQ